MRILVVDDDPLAAELTAAILEDAGHDVVFVENAMEALGALKADSGFEVVISDMNMPLIDGLELFSTLRDQGIELPFILLTGDDPQPLRLREPRLGVCIVKDMDLITKLPAELAAAFAPPTE
ncbi:MAG: response regulator [Alphaproteobacteria bacterium]|nr:response regulator [Alphaproteobacteria bacterium]